MGQPERYVPLARLIDSDINQIVDSLSDRKIAGKRVLVTGANGFLGRYFMAVFAKLGTRLTGVDIVGSDEPEVMALDVTKELGFREFDIIVHCAGNASPANYRAKPIETLDVSYLGTRNILDLAKRCGPETKVLVFSSSEIYGDPDPRFVPTPETYRGNISCLGPRACYDEGKRVMETLSEIYANRFGVKVTIARPFNVYGPGMNLEDYRVLPNFARAFLENRPLEVYSTGKQTRTFCYVTDAITGFLKVLLDGKPGEAYNVGNPTPEIDMLTLARMSVGVTGVPSEVLTRDYPDTYPGDEPQRRCPDISKVQALGYAPKVELSEGLRRFFVSYL